MRRSLLLSMVLDRESTLADSNELLAPANCSSVSLSFATMPFLSSVKRLLTESGSLLNAAVSLILIQLHLASLIERDADRGQRIELADYRNSCYQLVVLSRSQPAVFRSLPNKRPVVSAVGSNAVSLSSVVRIEL